MSDGDVIGRIHLPPAAGLVQSLGTHHTLESSVADLVDNSLDAGAKRVLVRLLTVEERLARVEVIDDGFGMDAQLATEAMTIGHRRAYSAADLGHFGMGLKAASLAHADNLTLWSKSPMTPAVGRRIRRAEYAADFSCDVLSDDAAEAAAEHRYRLLGSSSGTTVIWSGLRNVYRGRSSGEARSWMSTSTSRLRTHLGVVFHRLIERGRLELEVVMDELAAADGAVAVPVVPIDPFGYRQPGHPRYPREVAAVVGDNPVRLRCHIWPAKSELPGFRIGGLPGERFQGFFIYRNDRLLQAGGWSDTATPTRERQLARVVIDDTDAIGGLMAMNPEKRAA